MPLFIYILSIHLLLHVDRLHFKPSSSNKPYNKPHNKFYNKPHNKFYNKPYHSKPYNNTFSLVYVYIYTLKTR